MGVSITLYVRKYLNENKSGSSNLIVVIMKLFVILYLMMEYLGVWNKCIQTWFIFTIDVYFMNC